MLLFEKHIPTGPIQYFQSLLVYCKYIVTLGLSAPHIQEFFTFKKSPIYLRFNKDVFRGFLFSLPILAIFHLLFSQINADYVTFTKDVLNWLWSVISYILDIELLWIVLKGFIQGYLLYVVFSIEHTKENDKLVAKNWPLAIFKIVLASVVILFFVFSSFQSKLLLLDIFHLAFKEVSQYVQKGFIELLLVSFVGYALSLFILGHLPQESSKEQGHLQWFLTIFCLELITITVFIFHKLYALQAVFGFKDQRLLASGAALLILATFILLLFRIWKKISSTKIFHWQILLLASLMVFLHLINTDLFTSKYNSIRYTIGDVQYKDYSYLLGNSFDNVSEWPSLIKEAQKVGIPKPDETYYWGHFSASNKDFYGSSYSPICEKQEMFCAPRFQENCNTVEKYTYSSYLEKRYQDLITKYSSLGLKTPPIKLMAVNFHEYQAYRFIQENKSLIDTFISYAKSRCK